jgi:hypothetical protein
MKPLPPIRHVEIREDRQRLVAVAAKLSRGADRSDVARLEVALSDLFAAVDEGADLPPTLLYAVGVARELPVRCRRVLLAMLLVTDGRK